VTKRYFAEGMQRLGAVFVNGQWVTQMIPYYFTRDHLGSVREVTDATGALSTRYDYDPFGKPTWLTTGVDSDFGFTGHFRHRVSGLYLPLNRTYDPIHGRWTSRDPLGEIGGLNLYNYVSNSPIDLFDPVGLTPQSRANAAAVGATVGFILSLPVDALEDFFSGGVLIIANPATTATLTGLGGAAGAALDDLVSQMAGTKAGLLPSGGSCPYEPKKQKSKEPIRNKQGDYIDDKGNAWRWNPNKQEWDVQHPDGTHTNVSPSGEVTHGPNKF
jgi:RHS repeat-associated protein